MTDKARAELEEFHVDCYGDEEVHNDWYMAWAERNFGRERVTRDKVEACFNKNTENGCMSRGLVIDDLLALINGPERKWCSHYTWDCSLKKWVHLSEEWSHIASDADIFCRYCGKPRPGSEDE